MLLPEIYDVRCTSFFKTGVPVQALGYRQQVSHAGKNRLEQHEMNKLLERSKSDDAEGMASKGLGFAPCAPAHLTLL